MVQNVVIMGGSFNPPTLAHLKIMQAALAAVNGVRGYFVPVSFASLKRKMMRSSTGRICLPDETRLEMLKAVCREDSRLAVSELELGEIQTVTAHTLQAIAALHPGAKCFFLAGTDKLELMAHWGSTSDFLQHYSVILFSREGMDAAEVIERTQGLQEHRNAFLLLPQMPELAGISSTEVRRRFLSGQSPEKLLVPGVWQIMKKLKAEDFPEEIFCFQGVYEFMSNSWKEDVLWQGMIYPSAEAAFEAAKREYCQNSGSSSFPELTGEQEDYKLAVMRRILESKFSIPELAERLRATGNAVLINGGYGNDLHWGMDLYSWVGENHLGKLLMQLRDELR